MEEGEVGGISRGGEAATAAKDRANVGGAEATSAKAAGAWRGAQDGLAGAFPVVFTAEPGGEELGGGEFVDSAQGEGPSRPKEKGPVRQRQGGRLGAPGLGGGGIESRGAYVIARRKGGVL